MFADIHHFTQLIPVAVTGNIWGDGPTGSDSLITGVGRPGVVDPATVPEGNLWGDGPTGSDSLIVGVGAPGKVDPTTVPEGNLWGDNSDSLITGVGAPGVYSA